MRFSIYNKLLRAVCSSFQPKIIVLGIAAMTMLAASAADGRAASPGALDLSFGVRGRAALAPSSNFDEERALAIQPDGKIVIAGFTRRTCSTGNNCNTDFAVVRFNADGTPDTSFDGDGVAITDFFDQNEAANAVAVQADGKIVVAGGLQSANGGTNILGFKLVRYNTDGSLDTTFDADGRVYESFDDAGGIAKTMLIQPDGKIVVAGTDENSMLFVARFNPNGSLDMSFGTNGRIASNSYNVYLTKIVRQTDGKILVAAAGLPFGTFKLIRFNADGTPDINFGTSGVATANFTDAVTPSVAVQSDGKILASGAYVNSDIRTPPLRRFNADGSVDTGFVPNHGSIVNGACTDCTQRVVKILPLADGRFYLAGYYSSTGSSPSFMTVSRYLSSGAIDSSFGFRGTSRFRHTNSTEGGVNILWRVNDAALQADGKVVVAATANLPFGASALTYFIGMRITASVTPPSVRGDFDGDRRTDFSVFRPSNRFWYVLNSFDNSFLVQRYGADGDVLTPGDYNYDLKTDLAVFRPGDNTWYISPSLPASSGINGGGVFGQTGDINVAEDYDGDGYTDIAAFRPSNGTWYIRYSALRLTPSATPAEVSFPFGLGTDKPAPADYDGDGKADIAVFRPSNGVWYILRSSDNAVLSIPFGISTDKTVQGDYDGDGRADIAVFRDGNWYILRSQLGFTGITWGFGTDKPVPGDYDGDGKFDVAVFRPSSGAWYALKSSDSSVIGQQWGTAEDTPIPFTFVR